MLKYSSYCKLKVKRKGKCEERGNVKKKDVLRKWKCKERGRVTEEEVKRKRE